ncbi:MAG TPA: Holliday junction branch migration protein RuvA [Armatimonadota bacterium]|nr:Holliday junction branch migration protein RuvA [Armatimonadota bacterium]
MITYIQGKIIECKPAALVILAGGIGYEVMIAPAILAAIPTAVEGNEVTLVIYYYLQIDQSRATPVMIGFRNSLEREFFEQFIRVASIGPRTAVKAIAQPIQKIAAAIENGDMRFLTGLPGVGRQKAKEIVAKLQGKMGAYCLLDGGEVVVPSTTQDAVNGNELEAEALAVLLQLQYTRNDAQQMIKRALASTPPPTTTEEVLELIYRQGRG